MTHPTAIGLLDNPDECAEYVQADSRSFAELRKASLDHNLTEDHTMIDDSY